MVNYNGIRMDLRKNLIICIGSPMIDITARVPSDFLKKYNLRSNNAIPYSETCSEIFKDLQIYNPKFTVGGSITHAVQVIQKNLEFSGVCCYLGAIGKDEFGTEIKRKLKDEEVSVFFEEIDGEATSKCAVLLLEDNRSFVTDLGASKFLSEAFIESDGIQNVIGNGKYYYMSAFFFRVSYPVLRKICTHAKMEGKIFTLNIGATFLCLQYIEEFKETLPYVNILIGNAEESARLANVLGCVEEDPFAITLFLQNKCSKSHATQVCVIVTRGSESVMLATSTGVKEFQVPSLKIGKRLNTSGAGDYFAGGFLAKFMLNGSIEDCIQAGITSSYKLIQQNS